MSGRTKGVGLGGERIKLQETPLGNDPLTVPSCRPQAFGREPDDTGETLPIRGAISRWAFFAVSVIAKFTYRGVNTL